MRRSNQDPPSTWYPPAVCTAPGDDRQSETKLFALMNRGVTTTPAPTTTPPSIVHTIADDDTAPRRVRRARDLREVECTAYQVLSTLESSVPLVLS